jgi:hypothetical protein
MGYVPRIAGEVLSRLGSSAGNVVMAGGQSKDRLAVGIAYSLSRYRTEKGKVSHEQLVLWR